MGSKSHWQAYFAALGEFVTEFSKVELSLRDVLCAYSGITRGAIRRVIFQGVRVAASGEKIRGIIDATGASFPQLLEEALTQLAHVNYARDCILHWGAEYDGNGVFVVANDPYAATAAKTRKLEFTVETLTEMTVDLKIIVSRLQDAARQRAGGTITFSSDQAKAMYEVDLQQPWRYKPPQLAAPNRKSRDTTRKR